MRRAFVFDPNRCTGCSACELACSIENRLGTDRSWRSVLTFNQRGAAGAPRFHLSIACNHCETAACMEACPALAYERDPVSGAVLIRQELCIGCRYCSWACPYGAPRFEPEHGVMGKCTFCEHRLAKGAKPACAALCPTGALDYAELPESELSARIEGLPRTDLGPSIRVLPPSGRSLAADSGRESSAGPIEERGPAGPGSSTGPAEEQAASHEPRIDLRGEWSLAAFTLLLTILFALLASDVTGARQVSAVLFAGIAALAAALSLAHLGRPERAWRAVLGVRRSPVSREVLGFGSLATLGTAALAWPDPSVGTGLGWAAIAAGVFALGSADGVYRPVYERGDPLFHSGGVALTGFYLAGLAAGVPWLAGGAGLLKLVGFLKREGPAAAAGPPGIARIGLGLLLPAAAWATVGTPLPVWSLALAAAGESIDRAGFYTELEIESPARQIRRDLAARLARTATVPAAGKPEEVSPS